jgi:hypothetical protein
MNKLRTGARQGSDGAINEPENARFQDGSLLQKALSRPQANHTPKLISDWQSLNHSSTLNSVDMPAFPGSPGACRS